jgi:hypothetical protein
MSACTLPVVPAPAPKLVSSRTNWTMPRWMEPYRSCLVNPANPYPVTVEDLLNADPLDQEMKERKQYVRVQITLLLRLHEDGYL